MAVETMSGGIIFTGDLHVTIQRFGGLPTTFAAQIHNFRAEYLGTAKAPVPFGGREDSLAPRPAYRFPAAPVPGDSRPGSGGFVARILAIVRASLPSGFAAY